MRFFPIYLTENEINTLVDVFENRTEYHTDTVSNEPVEFTLEEHRIYQLLTITLEQIRRSKDGN